MPEGDTRSSNKLYRFMSKPVTKRHVKVQGAAEFSDSIEVSAGSESTSNMLGELKRSRAAEVDEIGLSHNRYRSLDGLVSIAGLTTSN